MTPIEYLAEEIQYHEMLVKTILEFKKDDGISRVTHAQLAKTLNKNQTWICKAINRLNAEDTCIEMIKRGEYKVHYTNIRERGVFPKIIELLIDKTFLEDYRKKNCSISEKYHLSNKTVKIFTGYLGFMFS